MKFHKPDINRILFSTDFSENADRAFGYAASLADAHHAVVTVLRGVLRQCTIPVFIVPPEPQDSEKENLK